MDVMTLVITRDADAHVPDNEVKTTMEEGRVDIYPCTISGLSCQSRKI